MTDLKPLSAEELAETRGLVWPRGEGEGWCNLCGFGWPCRCAALLATIEALQAEVTTLRTALEKTLEDACDFRHEAAREALHGRE